MYIRACTEHRNNKESHMKAIFLTGYQLNFHASYLIYSSNP